MTWFIAIITILFGMGTIAEDDKESKKLYVTITCVGLLSLGIAVGL